MTASLTAQEIERDESFDYFEDQPDLTCPHCNGTGGEPYDDGITPCEECGGEGYQWWI